MILTLYKTQTSDNTLIKVLEEGQDFWINLKRDVDVINPVIRLVPEPGIDFKKFNYAQLVDLNRFYFIDSIEHVHSRIWEFTLSCDVLFTYRADILASHCRYNRNIKTGDYVDTTIDMSTLTTVEQYDSDVTAFTGENTIILSTLGA